MTVNEVIASLGGNVILLAAVGWLIKTLLSHRFSLEAEKFKVEVCDGAGRLDSFRGE